VVFEIDNFICNIFTDFLRTYWSPPMIKICSKPWLVANMKDIIIFFYLIIILFVTWMRILSWENNYNTCENYLCQKISLKCLVGWTNNFKIFRRIYFLQHFMKLWFNDINLQHAYTLYIYIHLYNNSNSTTTTCIWICITTTTTSNSNSTTTSNSNSTTTSNSNSTTTSANSTLVQVTLVVPLALVPLVLVLIVLVLVLLVVVLSLLALLLVLTTVTD